MTACQHWPPAGAPAATAITSVLGRQGADLCAALIEAGDDRTAARGPVHDAAEALRAVCQACPQEAEAARQALLRVQVEGDLDCDAGVRRERGKPAKDAIRRRWNSERYYVFLARDALSVGLGWPHRGEPVIATGAPCYPAPAEYQVTGAGIYLDSNDTHNTGHSVRFAAAGRPGRRLLVMWEPRLARHGSADPAGDIRMRLAAEPGRRLPVPLLRWPEPADIDGGAELAAAAALPGEDGPQKPAGRALQLDLFGDGPL